MGPEPLDLNRPKGNGIPEQLDHGCVSGTVEVVFRDYRRRLLQLLEEARRRGLVCLGAVAWMTDSEILDALARLPTSLIVQKELYLRSDDRSGPNPGWAALMREQFDALAYSDRDHDLFLRQNFPAPLGNMNLLGDQQISGVRCCGARALDGHYRRGSPLMHNKFLVFARLSLAPAPGQEEEEDPDGDILWEPEMVWTGSCNLSRTAARSRENSIIIRDPKVATAYLREWVDLMCLSESLDWQSEDPAPEWRQDT